jgi:hypothetical protein
MCLIFWVKRDIFEKEAERINQKESRLYRALRRLVFKFVPGREASPPPYAQGAFVQQAPRKANLKRPDSLTLPSRKHVGAQAPEEVAGPKK